MTVIRRTAADYNDVPLPSEADLKLVQEQTPMWACLADVEMKPVRWLKYPFWQADAFHLLVGEKGCGKGTFLAGLAAKVTRDGKRVLWVAAGEDSLAIDVKPRIVAAGGDPSLVMYPTERLILPDCVEAFLHMGRHTGDLGLIVLDPIVGLMTGGRNSNADTDVRGTIDPLNGLADELCCPVVGVRHLGKDTQRGALHRVLGGVDWVNIPRAVIAIAADDEDVRHIQVISGNRVPPGEASRPFLIEEVELGDGVTSTKAVFNGNIGKDVEDVLSKPRSSSKTKAAKERVLDILDEEGEQESDALSARVAKQTGLAAKTVKNATTALKDDGLVKFRPVKDDEGKILRWLVSRSLAPRPDRDLDTGSSPVPETISRTSTTSTNTSTNTTHPDSPLKGSRDVVSTEEQNQFPSLSDDIPF